MLPGQLPEPHLQHHLQAEVRFLKGHRDATPLTSMSSENHLFTFATNRKANKVLIELLKTLLFVRNLALGKYYIQGRRGDGFNLVWV